MHVLQLFYQKKNNTKYIQTCHTKCLSLVGFGDGNWLEDDLDYHVIRAAQLDLMYSAVILSIRPFHRTL